MIASMETYLRRGRRTCQRLLLNPKIRTGGVVLLCGGSGFLLSAASLGNYPQPLAMGLILAMSGWHAAVMSLGAMLGYWVFWGIAGLQGLVWSASGGLLALLLARHIPEEQPLIFPAISAFLTALTGLLFQLVLRDTVPVPVYFLRIVLAAGAGLLFPVALGRRTAVTDWLVGGVAVLALAQGTSLVTEGVYGANRFKYVDELKRLGAHIQVDGKVAVIEGVDQLVGAPIQACDLRAGAALVIAGLAAKGTTELSCVQYIERGYEDLVGKLRAVGADIAMVDVPEESEAESHIS